MSVLVPPHVMRHEGTVTIRALRRGFYGIHISGSWSGRVRITIPRRGESAARFAVVHRIGRRWKIESREFGQRTVWVNHLSIFGTLKQVIGKATCLIGAEVGVARCLLKKGIGAIAKHEFEKLVGHEIHEYCPNFSLTMFIQVGHYCNGSPPQPPVITPDQAAPTTPTGLNTSSTSSSLTLAWAASGDNVGVSGYDAYLNGSKVATVGGTSYTFGGLACGHTYALGVVAFDAAGNRSGEASINGSTAACATNPPPPSPSISAARGGVYGCSVCHTLDIAVHNFPTGTFTYYCHDNSGSGGSDVVFYSHAVTVTNPNQSTWPGVFCYDSAPYVAYLVMDGVRSNSVQF